jgi:hypothetical protein
MSKGLFLPNDNISVDFYQGSSFTARNYAVWHKPRGKSMLQITAIGAGGNGSLGAVGANSAAAGGGGGGSGGQSILTIPLAFLPDVLYIYAGQGGSGLTTVVSIAPGTPAVAPSANYTLLTASFGGTPSNASGATPGAAGTAGAIATIAGCPLAGRGNFLFLAGQAGIIGGVAVAGANLTLPVTGLCVTGGTGGGGLPAAAASGTNGGTITGVAQTGTPDQLISVTGGAGSATATSPANPGRPGYVFGKGLMFIGGSGSASTHGTATGAGLAQGRGGDGALGCGGGGTGGGLTGSAVAAVGKGGDGAVWMVTW